MSQEHELIKVGITIGDINGVGMEVIIKSLLDHSIYKSFTPIVYGSSKVASYHRKALNIADFSFNIIKSAEQANVKLANLINLWDDETKIDFGQSTETAGKYSLMALEAATADLKAGKIDVLVTAPINKHNIHSDKFKFAGHTEYLAQYFGSNDHAMMLINDKIRVALVTEHLPLSKVAASLTSDKILRKLKVVNESLIKDFGIRKPKIAVLGLNPHAGDNGLLGNEEKEIIIPAINTAKEQNILAIGPYAADGFFGAAEFMKFDAVLAMYHDQGLVPFKYMAFEDGVNYTAGLPVIRTSPDHGTAYDIAGKGIASESSMRHAMYAAVDIFQKRNQFADFTKNPLKASNIRKERESQERD